MTGPLGIGIIGMGRMGSHHADRMLLRNDCSLIALCDPSAEARERAAAAYGCAVGDDALEILADPQVEAVFICTPAASHKALALAALEAGKHVVVETPLCRSAAEAQSVLGAATRAGRTLTVAHTRRWDDHFRTAQGVVASGRLGKLQDLKHVSWQHAGGLADADALEQFAPHAFDQLLLLVDCPAVDVYAVRVPAGGSGFLAVIRFESDVTAHVEVNRSSLAPLSTGWVISGSAGAYHDFCVSTEEDGEIVPTPLPREPTDWELFYTGLVRHLRQGEPLPVRPEQAAEVVRLIEATRRSIEGGEVVALAAIG